MSIKEKIQGSFAIEHDVNISMPINIVSRVITERKLESLLRERDEEQEKENKRENRFT